MLSKITILSLLLFVAIYPLCFWINFKDPLKQNFHRFHLGLPALVAGVLAVFLISTNMEDPLKMLLAGWATALLMLTFVSWKKESPNVFWVALVCLTGLSIFAISMEDIIGKGVGSAAIFLSILGGFIFSSCLYAMNLGHWYLNVHGLPIHYLKRAVYVFGLFLVARFLADGVLLFTVKTAYLGEMVPLYKFSLTTEGFFIWLALFFGTFFPLFGIYFVLDTLSVKNTQSATGILYALLCSVLIGDITYKYYLIQFGIAL
ncbi:MAG: hypothetical protein A2Z88_04325 [Omnitrophica WOR_2 bacterium GWA2_47_8]|nr:MAG: hypothetical protein A2Z88_04325 [Omnitrophica WOR_2 bacterium GWA2_47_8]